MPRPPDRAAGFRAERRRAVATRVHRISTFALFPIALAIAANSLAFDENLAAHLSSLVLQGVLCATSAWVTGRPAAERHALGIAVVLSLGQITIEAWAVHLAGPDAASLSAVLVGIMLFTSLAFPWGAWAQVLTSGYAAGCYLLLIDWGTIDSPSLLNLLLVMSFGLATSIVGAHLFDRQRRETFLERERVGDLARQREQLLDAGHALNATVDLDALLPMLTARGCALLGCLGTAFARWHEDTRSFESVVASLHDGSVVQLDLPVCPEERLPPEYVARLKQDGCIALTPADVRNGGAPEGYDVHALSVAVQRDGRLLGALTFCARDAALFGEQSRRLALGFASQAAIALTNAELVSRLTDANRIKSEFVSTISHELRTPLNVILGFTEIAMDAAPELPAMQEYLRKISNASMDLHDLIETTLAIGRLDAGRDDPRFETVALPVLWSDLHDVCSRLPRNPGVALAWQADVPAHALVTDPRKLSVVVRNLVGNALKFTLAGAVTVSASLEGARLRLAVSDTGVGIKPEYQQSVFDMFRQGDSSDSRRFGGTGLGLYIVRQYTAQLGGTISLASSVGRGSTFELLLPVDGSLAARRAA